MNQPPPRLGKTRLYCAAGAAGLALIFSCVYMSTRTWAFSYDALTAVLTAERNAVFPFHPNHLFANGLGWIFYKGLSLAGIPTRAVFAFQTANAVVGGCAVGALFYLLAVRFSAGAGLLGALGLGLSYAFWAEAVDAGAYASTGLLAVILTGQLLRLADDHRFKTHMGPPLTAGVMVGAGLLIHQMFLLTIPAFLILLYFSDYYHSLQQKVRPVSLFLSGLFLAGIVPYILIARFYYNFSVGEGLFWFFGPAGPRPNSGILVNSWWHWKISQNMGPLWNGLVNSLMAPPPHHFEWAHVLVSILWGGGLLSIFGGSLWLIFVKKKHRRLLAAILAWIVAMNLFQFFWVPGTVRFRILFLPVFILCSCLVLENVNELVPTWRKKTLSLLLCLIVGIGFSNALGTIWPAAEIKNNRDIQRALWAQHRMTPRDFFLFAGSGDSIMNVVPPYFAPNVPSRSLYGYFFSNPSGDFSEIATTIEHTLRSGGNVYMEEALFNRETWSELAPNETTANHIRTQWISRYEKTTSLSGPFDYRVVGIRLKP
jgi:hypothetical protein